MENELELTKKRLAELARRAEKRSESVASEFLTPAEQLELTRLRLEPYVFDGGYPQAERRCAVFLPWEDCECSSHVVCLEIRPANEKFAETLTHRDYLGALMALVFNGETAGGFRLARTSSIRDGVFDCILLERKNFLRSVFAMVRYLLGGRPRIVRHLRAATIDIESALDEPTDVDGQKGARFPLRIECLAGGLRVVCPPRA